MMKDYFVQKMTNLIDLPHQA